MSKNRMSTLDIPVSKTTAPTVANLPRPQRRPHSHPIPAAASRSTSATQGGPNHTAASTGGARTSAETIRHRSVLELAGAKRGAVAAFAAVIVAERVFEVALAEIGPHGAGEDELGVSGLPEQEVADALLAAGADDEIGVGHVGGEEMMREEILVDGLGRQRPGLRQLGDGAGGTDDLGAAAIGKRHGQSQPEVVGGQRLGIGDEDDDVLGKARALADDLEPDAIPVQLGDLAAQIMAQQAHQVVDLDHRPLPILRREAEKREIGDAELAG